MRALSRPSQNTSSSNYSQASSSPLSSSWSRHLRSVLHVGGSNNFSPASCYFPFDRDHHKSLSPQRKKKHPLSARRWRTLFTADGKLHDAVKFLKKVRKGGVDQSIRPEVWPFLLGVDDLASSKKERDAVRSKKREEYEQLREQCCRLLKHKNELRTISEIGERSNRDSGSLIECMHFPNSLDAEIARVSVSSTKRFLLCDEDSDRSTVALMDGFAGFKRFTNSTVAFDSDSMDLTSSGDPEVSHTFSLSELVGEIFSDLPSSAHSSPSKMEVQTEPVSAEDFATWQRIIRLDAIRASGEWTAYSPAQAAVSEATALHSAEVVGLKDYDHLDPGRIYHASRLVAILEAYAFYDPEIGYCQGMSELLSPIISVILDNNVAFWCFVGFMKKARQNFRLDEVGIRRQLNIVSKIIKYKDARLYRHLKELQAQDCSFVYRMVLVLFRRELTFEQTLTLWEVIWADQAALRAGLGKSAQSRPRGQVPPTDDLLLYAIAASVLQRRKQIIEKHNSMDEIVGACNAMAGRLDVWKLLDDAHNLVATLHDKIETPF